MKKILILLLAIFFFGGCTKNLSFRVTGKVARDDDPQKGASVYAYKAHSLLDFSKPDIVTKTDDSGFYSLVVKDEGEYYITARASEEGEAGPDLFAFYGRNPVYVTERGVNGINLKMQKIKDNITFEKSDQTAIKCVLTHNGKPLSGANVFVAVDLNEGMRTKGLLQSDMSDERGECTIPVDTGRYYLTSRKRLTGTFGPMKKGDLIGFFHKNPIVIKEKGLYTVNIELIDIMMKSDGGDEKSSNISVSGRILDENEKPIEGIWVGVYTDPQMFGKPVYLSKKSDKNGNYVIKIPKVGKYYLAGRDTLGGPPNPGELYGSYNGTDDHSVDVTEATELTDIDITVREMW